MTDDEFPAPGLKQMKRKNGRVDLYWVASEEAVKRGYPVKTSRLFGDLDDIQQAKAIAGRCQVLQAEMLEWMAGVSPSRNFSPAGTIAWLCDGFQTDEDSTYHDLRASTQGFYDDQIKIIKKSVGERRIDTVFGKDVRRWYRNWGRYDETTRKMQNPRRAYACIQTLRRVASYGCELRDPASGELAAMLAKMEFSAPRRRQVRPTYEQIAAFRQKARSPEFERPSMARAVALQFDLALRQKDVIGEWIRDLSSKNEGIMDGRSRWSSGLLWGEHITRDMLLTKPTSKSNFTEVAEHDLKAYPDSLAELTDIPVEKRIGPVIINEKTGKPYKRREFAKWFRLIADASGWPKGLWNRDTKAGAISEAFDAGALTEDVQTIATHREQTTTMIYKRGGIEQSNRVAKLRLERREQGKNRDR